MRRVLIASRLYAPEVGAAAFRLRALARGLSGEGAAVTVVTTNPPRGSGRPARDAGVRVRRLPVLRDAGGNVRGYVQYLSFDIPLFFRLLVSSADLVVSEPPPTTGLVVAVTSWLRRRPYAYYAADVWTDGLVALGAPGALIRIMRAVEGFVLRNAAAVVAVSDEVADKVAAFGTARSSIAVVGNGVDTDTFTPLGESVEVGHPMFVYTGAMSEWQSPTVFVEALPLVREVFPEATIRFFGQGVEEPELKRTAARLGLETVVLFGGVIPPAQTATWIRSATAALASISPGAGYDFAKPTKTYAAAACGVPVVFAGEGAGASLVADNDLGWRCGHDARSVADAMIAAAEAQADGSSAAQRERRAAWAREHASIAAAGTAAARRVLEAVRAG